MKFKYSQFNVLRTPETDDGSSNGGGDGQQATGTAGNGTAGNAAAASGEQKPTALLNDDYSFSDGWQDRLGDDAKGLTFKNLPDLLKSVKSGTTKISELTQKISELGGGEGTPIPTDSAGYIAQIKLPEAMPEGVHVPEGLLAAAAKYGIDNKIPPSITQKFVEFQIEQAGQEAQAIKDASFANLNTSKAEISKLVGPENYDKAIGDAQAAHDMLGLGLESDDLKANPRLVVALAKIQTVLSPGTLKGLNLTPDGQSATGKLTQAEDIAGNKENPDYKAFHDSTDPRHEAVMERFNRLIAESGGK